MKITPLEFNCISDGLERVIEGLQDQEYFGSKPLNTDECHYLRSAETAKAKFDELQKAIESEGGFSSAEIHLNE